MSGASSIVTVFDADLQTIWRDSTVDSKTVTIEDAPLNHYPAYTLLNGTLGYRFGEKVRLQLAVINLLDKSVPIAAQAGRNFGSFDPLGRRYFLTLFANF